MKNLKIKKLLTSLTAIGLTAATTVSVVACSRQAKKEELGTVILKNLTADTSVLYTGGEVEKVIEKIKLIIKNDSKLDANLWNLDAPKIDLKDKAGTSVTTGTLKKENYSFTVEIKPTAKNNSASPMQIAAAFTVKEDNKKIDTTLLKNFDKSRVNTQLDGVKPGDVLSDKVSAKILEAVKKQFLGVEDEVTVVFKTAGDDLKANNDKKNNHNFKFTLNVSGTATSDFDLNFKYELTAEQTKVDLAGKTINLEITVDEVKGVAATNLSAVTNANLKSILDSKILTAIKNLRQDADNTDYTYEIYTTNEEAIKESGGTALATIDVTGAAIPIFVKITGTGTKLENSKIVNVSVPKTS